MLENEKKPETPREADFGVIVEAAEDSCAKAMDGPKTVLQIVGMMASIGEYNKAHADEFTDIIGNLVTAHEVAKTSLRKLSIKIEAAKLVK